MVYQIHRNEEYMSEQINVESIMKEIKKEIEVKGYTNDLLSFQ